MIERLAVQIKAPTLQVSEVSFGKTLKPEFLPVVLEVPCMAAAIYDYVSEWVLESVHTFTHILSGCE